MVFLLQDTIQGTMLHWVLPVFRGLGATFLEGCAKHISAGKKNIQNWHLLGAYGLPPSQHYGVGIPVLISQT